MKKHGAIHAVIFDLDGVLIDSWELAKRAFRHAYEQCVGPEDEAPTGAFRAAAGAPFSDILAHLSLPASMQRPFEQFARQNLDRIEVYGDAVALVEKLQALGHPMAVLTGKDETRTGEVLEHTGLAAFFTVVATPQNAPGKPDPGGPLYCCRELQVGASQTALVGDSLLDMEAARNAGICAVFAQWGAAAMLPPASHDHALSEPAELLALLR